MRKLLLFALLVALSNFGRTQTTGPGFVIYVGSAPSGTCSAGAYLEQVIGLGTVYTCQSGTWTQVSGGGGSGVTSVATTTPITGGTITGTGTIACATCVKATSPGAGIAHFAGSTQEVTSSLIVNADITASTIDLTTKVTGALPVANGGTGAATLAAHGVVVGNTTSAVSVTGAGTSGQVLTSNGASADPTFQATPNKTICNLTGSSDTRTSDGTFATTCTLAANSLVAGSRIILDAVGVETFTSGPCSGSASTFGVDYDSTVIQNAGNSDSAFANTQAWAFHAEFILTPAGASGRINANPGYTMKQDGNAFLINATAAQVAYDSTTSHVLKIHLTGSGTGCGPYVLTQFNVQQAF